jgi:FkbM family methyltransferase
VILRRLKRMQEELDALRAEVRDLRKMAHSGRHVDLVELGDLRLFMYKGDFGHNQVPESQRGRVPSPPVRDLFSPPLDIQTCYDDPATPIPLLLMAHYWLHDLDFVFFDVGCHYGEFAMTAMRQIRASGRRNRLIAFDPGIAGNLVPFNLQLNGMQDMITYERAAVSQATYPAIIYTETDIGANNRFVNRPGADEGASYVCPSVSIDDYVRAHGVTQHLIAKIDTQGAEVEVMRGMAGTMAARHVCCIMEFTPGALISRVDPPGWLLGFADRYLLFDLDQMEPPTKRQVAPIDPVNLRPFLDAVSKRPYQWSDVLLLPKSLPGAGALVKRLSLPPTGRA